MTPDTEYLARQLAHTILADSARRPHDLPGAGIVEVHMRGMTHEIRQQILVDHVSVAQKIADEIERQTTGINLDDLIAKAVKDEVARVRDSIPMLVKRHVESTVEQAVSNACKQAAAAAVLKVTSGVTEKLYAVAYPPRKRRVP